jgi:hypothetical protein
MIESMIKCMFESMFENINFYSIYFFSHTKLEAKQVSFLAWFWWKPIKNPQ